MKAAEVREKYLKFFEAQGHKIIPPAPLVLENDPTTLFTSSGMQPLVPYLMGESHPEGKRLTDSQPCLRVHGLDDDIDDVGDNRHTTFFEMLGNWSLGNYFKKEQLPWLWEFLTKELKLPKAKLWVSVFEGSKDVPKDTESVEIWKKLGVPESRIVFYGDKKNWWSRSGPPSQMPPGEIGGPTSEVFYEFDSVSHDPKFGKKCHPNCDCGRFLEIGNSVFMVYKKTEGGLEELPNKNVDFGGGLERLTAATNNDPDVFKIDIFQEIIAKIEEVTGKTYKGHEPPMRIIADHVRAANALALSGIVPSNKLQGYVARRLIRRSVIMMKKLKSEVTGDDYRRLTDKHEIVEEVEKFNRTLDKGLREVAKIDKIDGRKAFDLYQSYGFPLEITEEIFKEKGQKIDKKEFKKEFDKHKEKSRSATAGVFKGGLADHSEEVMRLHTAHHLLLAALQKVIDPTIRQMGSNINAERLRMDFNFDRKLTEEEIKKVEDLIDSKVDEGLPVTKRIMPRVEAEKLGAQMEFSKKYPDHVTVYFIGNPADPFSLEFCGGPHVENTAELGHVKIIKTERVGSGVVRIYATCSGNSK